jgi:hypothetical protein
MNPLRPPLALCALAWLASACVTFRDSIEDRLPPTSVRVLRHPDSLELLVLDPRTIGLRPLNERDVAPEQRFHGYQITAHAPLDDARQRERLVALVFEEILRAKEDGSELFEPRWGVRAVKEGKVVDVLCSHPGGRIHVHAIDRKLYDPVIAADLAKQIEGVLATAGLEISPP